MLKPFVILALPRTGTRMLVSALNSHPDISGVKHEFNGSEQEFWKHPYVLSNYVKDWMLSDEITRIHVFRENVIAGAKSLLLLHYNFPDNALVMSPDEVLRMASNRKKWDQELAAVSDHSISYEKICGGGDVRELPVSKRLCRWLCVTEQILTTNEKKTPNLILANEAELLCLSA